MPRTHKGSEEKRHQPRISTEERLAGIRAAAVNSLLEHTAFEMPHGKTKERQLLELGVR